MSFKPPVCPQCGNDLSKVDYQARETFIFNKDTGSYEEDKTWGAMADVSCQICGADLEDIFPDGPVNYSPEDMFTCKECKHLHRDEFGNPHLDEKGYGRCTHEASWDDVDVNMTHSIQECSGFQEWKK